ncbi:RimK family alpha-L-glutamate ligase [Candidatus Bathyarchaeota archaeon]|nr:RimK family alpha-L-glutamate ligase [Candidatus Bathyarchaeota archaeon]
MKIGILGNDGKEWHIQRLLGELRRRGAEAYVFPATRLVSRISAEPKVSVKGYMIEDYDAVIVRRMPGGTAERVFYRMDALHMLEEYGVYVINPALSIEKSVNKYYTSALLEKAGIMSPRTVVTESFTESMRAFEELGGDVVVKPLFGSLGAGITRLTDGDIAYRVFRALESTQSVFYIQEYIPHGNKDIRAFVIGDEVVASMKRVGAGWKTNISSGAAPEPYEASDEEVETSLKAAETLGLEYTGVDLMRSEDDGTLYTLEVNSTPGWEGLQKVTTVDIAERLVEYVFEKLR